jgi:tripartite-type tricarboxylate transporter receptor subunit TctC
VKIKHVAYKGAAPALSDVAGGHIAMVFSTQMASLPLVKSGRLRLLAVTCAERAASAPDVPTVLESGVPGPDDVTGWYGISGPASIPAAILERLNRDINQVLRLPDVRQRLAAEGTIPVGRTPEQFGAVVRSEVDKWRRIIQQTGITPR